MNNEKKKIRTNCKIVYYDWIINDKIKIDIGILKYLKIIYIYSFYNETG